MPEEDNKILEGDWIPASAAASNKAMSLREVLSALSPAQERMGLMTFDDFFAELEAIEGEVIPASDSEQKIKLLDTMARALGTPTLSGMIESVIDKAADENAIEGEIIQHLSKPEAPKEPGV